jgi:polysaccharide pyruvyl transferase WcaK-like protein
MPIRLLRELLFLTESFRVAHSLDLLIICGGGQLLDSWGGPWQFPYTIFKWVFLAKLSRVKCYFLNLGAGPLSHPLSKWFVERALLLADYVSFRDDNSQRLIQAIGFSGISHVVADNVYALTLPGPDIHSTLTRRRSEFIVGVAPMAYCDPRLYWDKNQVIYDRYIYNLSQFCARLVRARYRLRLFTTDIWFDQRAIIDLEAAIKNELAIETSPWITSEPISGIDELLSQISQLDCVVTSKFHGVIFAHLLTKPILAISHHYKVDTLMTDLGLSEYCVDIRTFDVDVLTATFERLLANLGDIAACMPRTVAAYRRELALQFDQLFSPHIASLPATGPSAESRGYRT